VWQVVEYLPSKHKAPGSNPRTTKNFLGSLTYNTTIISMDEKFKYGKQIKGENINFLICNLGEGRPS
jgi:hypothetical protein